MILNEQNGIVYVLKPGDYQAGSDGDSINAGKCRHITFMLQFAALTGDAVLRLYSGATDGAKTTAETFAYRLASAAQGATSGDVYGSASTSSALTLTAATYQNKMLLVDIDVAALTEGQPYLTLNFSSAADALNVAVTAVLQDMKYSGATADSAVA